MAKINREHEFRIPSVNSPTVYCNVCGKQFTLDEGFQRRMESDFCVVPYTPEFVEVKSLTGVIQFIQVR